MCKFLESLHFLDFMNIIDERILFIMEGTKEMAKKKVIHSPESIAIADATIWL